MATTTKKNAVPVRLDATEDTQLGSIATETGLNKSEILRRACRFAFRKFLSGEVNVAKMAEIDGTAPLADSPSPEAMAEQGVAK